MTRDEAKSAVGRYGKVRGGKGKCWYGRVVEVDKTGGYVKWSFGAGRMKDRWYPSHEVTLHALVPDEKPCRPSPLAGDIHTGEQHA